MAAGAEKEADPTKKKKKKGNKFYVSDVIFQILFNFLFMFLRQRKKMGGKTDTAGRMRKGLKPMLIKEPAKDTLWKDWRKGLQRNILFPTHSFQAGSL